MILLSSVNGAGRRTTQTSNARKAFMHYLSCIVAAGRGLYFTSRSSRGRSFMRIVSLRGAVSSTPEAAAADRGVRLFHSREKL